MTLSILFGVDYSITSPSITIKRLDGSYVNYAFWPEKLHTKMISGYTKGKIEFRLLDGLYKRESDQSKTEIERFTLLADQISWCITKETSDSKFKFIPHLMAIEGYSFASKNSFAHKIGEATGMLMAKLDSNFAGTEYFKIFRPPPQQLKKSCGAKVSDGKAGTLAKFEEKFDLSFSEILYQGKPPKSLPQPITDVCDSWAALNWLEVNSATFQEEIDNRQHIGCRGVH